MHRISTYFCYMYGLNVAKYSNTMIGMIIPKIWKIKSHVPVTTNQITIFLRFSYVFTPIQAPDFPLLRRACRPVAARSTKNGAAEAAPRLSG